VERERLYLARDLDPQNQAVRAELERDHASPGESYPPEIQNTFSLRQEALATWDIEKVAGKAKRSSAHFSVALEILRSPDATGTAFLKEIYFRPEGRKELKVFYLVDTFGLDRFSLEDLYGEPQTVLDSGERSYLFYGPLVLGESSDELIDSVVWLPEMAMPGSAQSAHPSPGDTEKLSWQTADQLWIAEQVQGNTALEYVSVLASEEEEYLVEAIDALVSIRPLPHHVIPALTACLQQSSVERRRAAAHVLFYHQRSLSEVLPALRKAQQDEVDDQLRQELELMTDFLSATDSEWPVLEDSDDFWRYLKEGLLAEIGRPEASIECQPKDIEENLLERIWSSASEDQPYELSLQGLSWKSAALLGWSWKVRALFEGPDGELGPIDLMVDEPPVGALVRLKEPLVLAKSVLTGGTLLVFRSAGWKVVKENEARKMIETSLRIQDRSSRLDLHPFTRALLGQVAQTGRLGAEIMARGGKN
jgi:hypothetical protein